MKLLFLSRNFGHQLAISAGLDHASGDAVVIIDADLQDPPEVALEMAAPWREGWEVVHGVRTDRRGESRFKLWTANRFYRLLSRLSDTDMPLDAATSGWSTGGWPTSSAGCASPTATCGACSPGPASVRRRSATSAPSATAGRPRCSLSRMIGFAIDGLLSFSVAPLRFIIAIGFLMSIAALVVGVVAIVLKLAGALPPVAGWASLTVLVSFLAGMQLIVLGMIGLYVAKAYEQGKRRPLYLVASPTASTQRRSALTTYWAPSGTPPSSRSTRCSRSDSRGKKTM